MDPIAELIEDGRRFTRRPQAFGGPARLQLVQAQEDAADLYIYGPIGGWFGMTAEQFVADLRALQGRRLRVHLNSPGGDVFDGLAIYNTLRSHAGGVETIVEGIAASIASVVALAGRPVTMRRASMLMIHEPWGLAIGTAQEMLDMAAVLEKATGVLADVYAQKSGAELEAALDWMRAETWFKSDEAADAGLVDAVADDVPAADESAAARARFDLSAYRNTPAALRPSIAASLDAAALARQRDWLRNRRVALSGLTAA